MKKSIYEYSVMDTKGDECSLEQYKGKALLIINTASKCGFTKQYDGIEELYKTYKDQGFEVLAFPCNQFGAQEPGSDEEIASFCTMNFNTTFKVFKKIEVNGDNTSPLFKFLKEKAPGLLGSKGIKWNFTKFLISKDGKQVKRFAPKDKPQSLTKDIEKLLK
jgi:glutathione peroxidase